MRKAVYYNLTTGAYLRSASLLPDQEPMAAGAGEGIAISDDPNIDMLLHHVLPATGAIWPRPPLTLTYTPANKTAAGDGVAEVVISGLPNPAQVRVRFADGITTVMEEVTDGVIEVSSAQAGTVLVDVYTNTHLWEQGIVLTFT